jgi:hypothetical protein
VKYNELIWSDLDHEEKQIYHLAESFERRTKKQGEFTHWIPSAETKSCYNFERDGKHPGDKLRESKNWAYFSDVWEIVKDDPNFDIDIFMDSVFRNLPKDKQIFPSQLRTKRVLENYKEYRMALKMSDKVSDEKKMMEDIATTAKFIKRKIGEINSQSLTSFFNDIKDNNIISEGIFFCIQEMISPFYLVVSKSFEEAYNNLDKDIKDEIMDEDRLMTLRTLVRLKTPVYRFAKRVFDEDII